MKIIKRFISFIQLWIILICCTLISCIISDDQQIYDSFALIRTDLRSGNAIGGSGFAISDHIVVTACHVIYGAKKITVTAFYPRVTEKAIDWWCDPNKDLDIAFVVIDTPIFNDYLDIGSPHNGIYKGCIYGRNSDTNVVKRCGTAVVHDDHTSYLVMNAKHGMSGGPCIVERYGDMYVVGTIILSKQDPKNANRLTTRGLTTCSNLKDSEYFN